LEEEFWSALGRISVARGQTVSALIAEIDARRTGFRPLASELRILALTWYSDPTTDS
jgi:predicted DNA-binding ribbon-helix-helix protein